MVDSGVILIKFWLEVDMEEQTRRLTARIDDGRKIWKLSPMDLKSYNRWYDYSRARDEMFIATDSEFAPWNVVRSNDKKRARLNIISHVLAARAVRGTARAGRSSCRSGRSRAATRSTITRTATSARSTDARSRPGPVRPGVTEGCRAAARTAGTRRPWPVRRLRTTVRAAATTSGRQAAPTPGSASARRGTTPWQSLR